MRPLSSGEITGIVVGSLIFVGAVIAIIVWQSNTNAFTSFAALAHNQESEALPVPSVSEQDAPPQQLPDVSSAVSSKEAAAVAQAARNAEDAFSGKSSNMSLSELERRSKLVGTSADPQSRAKYVTGHRNKNEVNRENFIELLIREYGGDYPSYQHTKDNIPTQRPSNKITHWTGPQILSSA